MDLAGVPPEFRERVSDDGSQVVLSGMHLSSVPEWLENLTALTALESPSPPCPQPARAVALRPSLRS